MPKIKVGNKYLASNNITWTIVSVNRFLRMATGKPDRKVLFDTWPLTFKRIKEMQLLRGNNA